MITPLLPLSLALTLLLSFQTAFASLGNLSVIISPLEQPIFFLEDTHKYEKDKDEHYFDTLLKLFQEADDDPHADPDTIEYYVFVENAPAVDFRSPSGVLRNRKCVLESLCTMISAQPFRRTKVINCDPRKISRALDFIRWDRISIGTLSEEQIQAIKHYENYDLTTVTFQDVVDHFDELLALTKQMKDQWHEAPVLKAFTEILDEQERNRELLIRLFQHNSCLLEDTIASHAKGAISKAGYAIVNNSTHCFSKFLDAWVLHHLLQERNNRSIKRFIIIAGGAHTSNIGGALKRLKTGYQGILDQYSNLNRGDKLRLLKMFASEIQKVANPPATWQENVRLVLFLFIIGKIIYWVIDK